MEVIGDLCVGAAAGDGDEHLFLPLGERVDRLGRLLPGGRAEFRERRQQPGRDARSDECVAGSGGAHRLCEQLGTGVFEEESAGSGLERTVDVFVHVERGDDDDGEWVGDVWARESAGDLDAVVLGHPDVEEADIGAQTASELEGVAPVDCLAYRVVGRYLDEYRRTPEGWRFTKMTFVPTFTLPFDQAWVTDDPLRMGR
jgi:hypothetical protein